MGIISALGFWRALAVTAGLASQILICWILTHKAGWEPGVGAALDESHHHGLDETNCRKMLERDFGPNWPFEPHMRPKPECNPPPPPNLDATTTAPVTVFVTQTVSVTLTLTERSEEPSCHSLLTVCLTRTRTVDPEAEAGAIALGGYEGDVEAGMCGRPRTCARSADGNAQNDDPELAADEDVQMTLCRTCIRTLLTLDPPPTALAMPAAQITVTREPSSSSSGGHDLVATVYTRLTETPEDLAVPHSPSHSHSHSAEAIPKFQVTGLGDGLDLDLDLVATVYTAARTVYYTATDDREL